MKEKESTNPGILQWNVGTSMTKEIVKASKEKNRSCTKEQS